VAAQAGGEAPSKAALAIHAKDHLPPQLMLRASYYYLPEHLEQRRPGHQHKKAASEQSRENQKLSGGAKAGIAVGVILVVGLGVGVGVGVAVSSIKHMEF
jgi:hypothetical protein